MKSIIVAYPNKKLALRLRDVLVQNGYDVPFICAQGSSVLNIAHDMRAGVVVCASILSDMGANMLAESLPPDFDVVSLSSNGAESYSANLITLALPLQIDELIQTVSVLVATESSFVRRRSNEQNIISDAKFILIRQRNMTETQAHKYLQKQSMATGKKMIEVARDIIDHFTE